MSEQANPYADVDPNATDVTSASDAAKELLGDESTSSQDPEDADIPEDPDQVDLSASPGEETEEAESEELEAAAEETGKGTSDKELQKLKDHIDKTYAGDVDAYIKGWHENQSRMKEFSTELRELREALQSGQFNAQEQESDQPEEVEVAADSDVSFHTENLQSLEQEIGQANQYSQYYLQEAGKLSLKVERVEGKLENADESEVPSLRQELANLQSKVEGLMQQSHSSAKEAKNLSKDLKTEQRLLKQAEKRADEERSQFRNQRQQQKQAEQKIKDSAGSDFTKTANTLLDKYGVPTDAREAQFETLRAMVSSQIRSLGPNAPLQDIEALTNAVGESYFKSLESITKAKFGKASKTKLKSTPTRRTSSSTSPAAQSKKHRRDMSQADWDKRAAEIGRYYDSL